MPVPVQPVTAWGVICSIFHIVALSATAFRLVYRYRIRRLWWDDFFVAVAFPIDILYFADLWLRIHYNNAAHPRHIKLIAYWLNALPTFAVIWCARTSMALSLTRIIPPNSRLRYMSNGIAGLFSAFGVTIILIDIIKCNIDKAWRKAPAVSCRENAITRTEFSFDILGDVLLAVVPVIVLWHLDLALKQKRLVITVFAASILTACASIVLHTFLLGGPKFGLGAGQVIAFMSHIEATIALFVANLLLIVAIIYKRLNKTGNSEEDEDDGSETRVTKTVPDKLETGEHTSDKASE